MAFTDGMAFGPDGWVGSADAILMEVVPDDDDSTSASFRAQAERHRRYREAAPLAFAPATPEVEVG